MMKSVLIISGHDPSGGAGFITDIRAASFLNVYPFGAITNLTVQNSVEFTNNYIVHFETIKQQLRKALDERRPDAVKIGMLGNVDIVNMVVDLIIDYDLKNIVLDPVLKASAGYEMSTDKVIKNMQYRLFPRVTIMTPNISEAEKLLGIPVKTPNLAIRAAGDISHKFGCPGVVITGGHFKEKVTDTLFFDSEIIQKEAEKFDRDFHGSGCVFSTALASFLALGEDPVRAFERSCKFVTFIMGKSFNNTWNFSL